MNMNEIKKIISDAFERERRASGRRGNGTPNKRSVRQGESRARKDDSGETE